MRTSSANEPLFVGLDGGGTGCRARLEDAEGSTLATASAGPANLYQQGQQALQSVQDCVKKLLQQVGCWPESQSRLHVGLGLAGAELPSSQELLQEWHPPWAQWTVVNDAHTACLGAHRGGDGGLVVVGTGIVAWAIRAGSGRLLDGWGFPLADQGSGAWLGQRALQQTLRASDGIVPASPLTRHLSESFQRNPRQITEWAARARSADYARFARIVVEYAAQGDQTARSLLAEQAREVGLLIDRLHELQAVPVALLGGLAETVAAHLPTAQADCLVPAQQDAIAGALHLIRRSN